MADVVGVSAVPFVWSRLAPSAALTPVVCTEKPAVPPAFKVPRRRLVALATAFPSARAENASHQGVLPAPTSNVMSVSRWFVTSPSKVAPSRIGVVS
jgi:hypothetical protein